VKYQQIKPPGDPRVQMGKGHRNSQEGQKGKRLLKISSSLLIAMESSRSVLSTLWVET
jgi:hypothetical protein